MPCSARLLTRSFSAVSSKVYTWPNGSLSLAACIPSPFVISQMPKRSKKARGRPATGKGEPIMCRIQPEQLAALNAWIEAQPQPRPTRPAAIRALLDAALSRAKRR